MPQQSAAPKQSQDFAVLVQYCSYMSGQSRFYALILLAKFSSQDVSALSLRLAQPMQGYRRTGAMQLASTHRHFL